MKSNNIQMTNSDVSAENGTKPHVASSTAKPDCSRHKKEVAGVSDMKLLAEMIGDLHYESLSTLLYHLSDKLYADGLKDFNAGRTSLSNKLFEAQMSIHRSHQFIEQAWKVSKPFMNEG